MLKLQLFRGFLVPMFVSIDVLMNFLTVIIIFLYHKNAVR